MIFSIDDLIVHMSRYFKLQFGDLIFTGTPAGVGKLKLETGLKVIWKMKNYGIV